MPGFENLLYVMEEGIASFVEKRPPHFTDKVSSDMPDFYPWWEDRPFE